MEYVLLAADYSTRFSVAKCIRKAMSAAIKIFFHKEIFEHFGFPKELISDQGTPMMSDDVQSIVKEYGIVHRTTTAHHQQADGLAERNNQTIMTTVRQFLVPLLDQRDWARNYLEVCLPATDLFQDG